MRSEREIFGRNDVWYPIYTQQKLKWNENHFHNRTTRNLQSTRIAHHFLSSKKHYPGLHHWENTSKLLKQSATETTRVHTTAMFFSRPFSWWQPLKQKVIRTKTHPNLTDRVFFKISRPKINPLVHFCLNFHIKLPLIRYATESLLFCCHKLYINVKKVTIPYFLFEHFPNQNKHGAWTGEWAKSAK